MLEVIDALVVIAIYVGGFMFMLGIGGVIADYAFPHIPFIQRFIDSLPEWEDEE